MNLSIQPYEHMRVEMGRDKEAAIRVLHGTRPPKVRCSCPPPDTLGKGSWAWQPLPRNFIEDFLKLDKSRAIPAINFRVSASVVFLQSCFADLLMIYCTPLQETRSKLCLTRCRVSDKVSLERTRCFDFHGAFINLDVRIGFSSW